YVTAESLETALNSFRGTIQQTPPMYSALKSQGRRLHQLARAGIHVERASRTVEVTRLDLVRWEFPQLTVSVQCSRGVYIRSLAFDLGQLLGCGAHLARLKRLRTGPFTVEQAISMEELKDRLKQNLWSSLLYPPDYVVRNLSAVALSRSEERQIRNGQPTSLSPRTHYAQHMETSRAYSSDGRFVALIRFNRVLKIWQPFKVFQLDTPSPYNLENALN
ncbi:hypothetical protein M1N24_03080, partial [Dehalococcoidia bacterium]|nr:hypothetical protein [Dehalococcoidia bacterium]